MWQKKKKADIAILFKGALCSFKGEIQTRNINIYINEVLIQTQTYVFFP